MALFVAVAGKCNENLPARLLKIRHQARSLARTHECNGGRRKSTHRCCHMDGCEPIQGLQHSHTKHRFLPEDCSFFRRLGFAQYNEGRTRRRTHSSGGLQTADRRLHLSHALHDYGRKKHRRKCKTQNSCSKCSFVACISTRVSL